MTTPGFRYPDQFRNALMASHAIVVRAELWDDDGTQTNTLKKWADLNLVGGSVSADRAGSVRRTASVELDGSVMSTPAVSAHLHPFGAALKIFRGIRYADGKIDEIQVFTGRIDSVNDSLDQVSLRCSDFAANVVDSRFPASTSPGDFSLTRGKLTDIITALIKDVMPKSNVVNEITDPTVKDLTADPATSWDSDRSDALDGLCTPLQAEWMADMFGDFHIRPLPPVRAVGQAASWIIDGGDQGVLISRNRTTDRAQMFNQAVVSSEAIGGSENTTKTYELKKTEDPLLWWGGPFGKIPRFYTSAQVRTSAAAKSLAQTLVTDALSRSRVIQVECVANPKLQLGDVVRIFDGRGLIDGMFYVQSLELPLTPDQSMRLTCYESLISVQPTAAQLKRGGPEAEPRIARRKRTLPEHAIWTPTVPR